MAISAQKPLKKQNFASVNSQKEFSTVRLKTIDAANEDQRLDNYLMSVLKGVPKSHIYRLVRSGEVRVNKKRAAVNDHLAIGDVVRIPPVRVSVTENKPTAPRFKEGELPILFEDRDLLIVEKPSGLAAHGGSGVSFGLIERLRATRTDVPFLELAHRLDRDTSGAIVLCKTRKALVRFQEAIREGTIQKRYQLLVVGNWPNDREHVKKPLSKYTLASGERRVRVDKEGLFAHTIFTVLKRFQKVTLLQAELKTGRTHQIRVHAASMGYPLVGDAKYGDYAFNESVSQGALGIPFKRLFLHAYSLSFTHPISGAPIEIHSELPSDCVKLLNSLEKGLKK